MFGLDSMKGRKLEVLQERIALHAGVGHGRSSGSDRPGGGGGAEGGEGERCGSAGVPEAEGEGGGPERARERLLGEKVASGVAMEMTSVVVDGARESEACSRSHEREHVQDNKGSDRRS